MATFRLPFSGNNTQWIQPMTFFGSGNSVVVNIGESSSPETEAQILERIGSYGRQLGQITDAVIVLLRHLPHRASLPEEERHAIAALEAMAHQIDDIKSRHGRKPLSPSKPSPA